jgi:hypothetical protein
MENLIDMEKRPAQESRNSASVRLSRGVAVSGHEVVSRPETKGRIVHTFLASHQESSYTHVRASRLAKSSCLLPSHSAHSNVRLSPAKFSFIHADRHPPFAPPCLTG